MSLIAMMLLAGLANATDGPAPVVDAPTVDETAVDEAAGPAPAEPMPEPPTARSVMQVQLDKAPPPQAERRQQSDAERERLMKIYLDAMGKPLDRRSPGTSR